MLKELIVNGLRNTNYLVDSNGDIYNVEGHKMTLHRTENGYERVKLSRGCKRGMYLVHRLVAETYIANPDKMPIVNHLNSCRHDNRVENLEWTNNSKNQLQRFRENGYKGTKRKAVFQICLETGNIIKEWESPIEAQKQLGIQKTNISKVCLGERNKAGGFFWKYKQDVMSVETIEMQDAEIAALGTE